MSTIRMIITVLEIIAYLCFIIVLGQFIIDYKGMRSSMSRKRAIWFIICMMLIFVAYAVKIGMKFFH